MLIDNINASIYIHHRIRISTLFVFFCASGTTIKVYTCCASHHLKEIERHADQTRG